MRRGLQQQREWLQAYEARNQPIIKEKSAMTTLDSLPTGTSNEELLTWVYSLRQGYINQGFTPEQAKDMAATDFKTMVTELKAYVAGKK